MDYFHNLWIIRSTTWRPFYVERSVILKRSLVRLIKHKAKSPNRQYDFEINIFFDDAFTEKNKHDKTKILNSYVNSFLTIFEKVLTNNQLEIESHTQSGRFQSKLMCSAIVENVASMLLTSAGDMIHRLQHRSNLYNRAELTISFKSQKFFRLHMVGESIIKF